MATPTATATLNKALYAPGETIILTIDHADADRVSFTVSGVVTDSNGNTGEFSASADVDKGDVTITQAGGLVWSVQSETRNRTVFTATA